LTRPRLAKLTWLWLTKLTGLWLKLARLRLAKLTWLWLTKLTGLWLKLAWLRLRLKLSWRLRAEGLLRLCICRDEQAEGHRKRGKRDEPQRLCNGGVLKRTHRPSED